MRMLSLSAFMRGYTIYVVHGLNCEQVEMRIEGQINMYKYAHVCSRWSEQADGLTRYGNFEPMKVRLYKHKVFSLFILPNVLERNCCVKTWSHWNMATYDGMWQISQRALLSTSYC